MSSIPTPRISSSPSGSPRFSAGEVAPRTSYLGGQLISAGRGVQGVGEAVSEIEFNVDMAAAKESDNIAADIDRELLDDPKAGYLNQVGRAAIDGREQLAQTRQQRIAALSEGLKNPRQRALFKRAQDERAARFQLRADQHYAEQTYRWQDGVYTAGIKASVGDAALAWGTDGFAVKKALAHRDADSLANLRGFGEDDPQRAALHRAADTELHTLVMDSMMKSGHLGEASAYFKTFGKEMDPEAQMKVGGMLQSKTRDSIAWTFANELMASDATRAEKLAAINQSVRTGRMDGETAEKALKLMEHLENQDWQTAQIERKQVGADLKQMFAKDENLSVETLPPEVVDRLDRTGMRSDAYKIHRQVREARIADMLSDGKMDSLTLSRDVRSMNDFSRLIKQLEDRKPYGKDAQTPEGKQRLERIQKQIDSLSAQLEGMATRPRTYMTDGDRPLEAPNQDGKTATPPMINMQDFARQIREALYPGAPR